MFQLRTARISAFEFNEDMGSYTAVIPAWFNQAIADKEISHNGTKTCLVRGDTLIPIPDGAWVYRCVDRHEIGFVSDFQAFNTLIEPRA